MRVQNGEDARLEVEFCADPLPKQAWHFGRRDEEGEEEERGGNALASNGGSSSPLVLSAGIVQGRFYAETVKTPGREDCYVAALRINGAHADDTRPYLLRLTNEHGEQTHTVRLLVKGEVY